jgi:hypothetical protein
MASHHIIGLAVTIEVAPVTTPMLVLAVTILLISLFG